MLLQGAVLAWIQRSPACAVYDGDGQSVRGVYTKTNIRSVFPEAGGDENALARAMIGALIVARFDEQTLRSMADVLQSPVAAQAQAIYNEVKIQQGAFDRPGYLREVSSVVAQIGASYGATVNEMLSNVGASLGIETGHPPDYRDAAEDIPDAGYIFNDIIDMTYKDEYAAMVEDERVRIESKGLRDFYRVPNGLQDGNVMINP